MTLGSIRLQNFRSYGDALFNFSPGVNIIVGPNASGKTNLLEAVLVAGRGASYRVRDAELITFGEPWARIDAWVDDGTGRTVKIIVEPPQKTFEVGGRIFRRLSLNHTLPTVLFEPNHLALLGGSPERRREYLDNILAQITIGYASTVRAYRRTLAQRNALLKSGQATDEQLFPWNVRLSELAGRLVRARTELAQSTNDLISGLYSDLSQTNTQISIHYQAGADPAQYESHMLRQLESRLHTDILRGFTSFGPHREDLAVYFDNRPAPEVASRGEIRTLVLCLKIIELKILESRRGTPPLLLLDDVFSELDITRRRALTTHLHPYQTFITTTDADTTAHHFATASTTISTVLDMKL